MSSYINISLILRLKYLDNLDLKRDLLLFADSKSPDTKKEKIVTKTKTGGPPLLRPDLSRTYF